MAQDNLFVLNCSPNKEEFAELLNVINRSKKFNELGYAKIQINEEFIRPVKQDNIYRFLSSYHNTDSLKFKIKFGTIEPLVGATDLSDDEAQDRNSAKPLLGPEVCRALDAINHTGSSLFHKVVFKRGIKPKETEVPRTSVNIQEDTSERKTRSGNQQDATCDSNSLLSKVKLKDNEMSVLNVTDEEFEVESATNPINDFFEEWKAFLNLEETNEDPNSLTKRLKSMRNMFNSYNSNLQLSCYLKLGERIGQLLDELPSTMNFDELSTRFPGCTSKSLTFLKLLKILERNYYSYFYINAESQLKLKFSDTDEISSPWNEHSIAEVTRYLFNSARAETMIDFSGISQSWTYYGYPYSMFPIHVEEIYGVNSINMNVSGDVKLWIIIPPSHKKILEDKLEMFIKYLAIVDVNVDTLREAIFHKLYFVQPELLTLLGIPYSIVEQGPNQIIVTCHNAYHEGANLGVNLAIAVNVSLQQFFQTMCVYFSSQIDDIIYKSRISNHPIADIKKNIYNLMSQFGSQNISNMCQDSQEFSGYICTLKVDIKNCAQYRNIVKIMNDNLAHAGNLYRGTKESKWKLAHINKLMEKFTRIFDPSLPFAESTLDVVLWLSLVYEDYCFVEYYENRKELTLMMPEASLCHRKIPILVIVNGRVKLFLSLDILEDYFNNGDDSLLFRQNGIQAAHEMRKITDKISPYHQKIMCIKCYDSSKTPSNPKIKDPSTSSQSSRKPRNPIGIFDSERLYNYHVRNSQNRVICTEIGCNKPFFNRRKLVDHTNLYHRKWTIICPYCRTWFDAPKLMVQHYSNNSSNCHLRTWEREKKKRKFQEAEIADNSSDAEVDQATPTDDGNGSDREVVASGSQTVPVKPVKPMPTLQKEWIKFLSEYEDLKHRAFLAKSSLSKTVQSLSRKENLDNASLEIVKSELTEALNFLE